MEREILILINSLGGGGAERLALKLFNFLNAKKLILLEKDIAYPVKGAKLLHLSSHMNETPGWWKTLCIPAYAKNLCRLTNKHTVVLSLLERSNFVNILAARKAGFKSIISVRVSPFHERKRWHPYNFFMKALYPRADKIVAVSKVVKEELAFMCGIPRRRIEVIYNPVQVDEIERQAGERVEDAEFLSKIPSLVTMGRITYQKGQWFLLKVLKYVRNKIKDARLIIIGRGNLEAYIVKLARELGFKVCTFKEETREGFDVYLTGFQRNPFKFISKSSVFLFPSLWEGFPNALLEAMACRVPVISADCRSGPREILAPDTDFMYQTHEPEFAQYGVLMPVFEEKSGGTGKSVAGKEEIWADVICEFLRDARLREHYAEKAKERAKSFVPEKILPKWKRVVKEV
jgi:glycosyltransferase involved in cell wall biosynthesis